MSSKLWEVRRGLVELFADVLPGREVINGPVARKGAPDRFVLVGTDGGETGTGEGAGDGARATQQWANLSATQRDEAGDIMCAVWAWSGSTDLEPLREQVEEDVAAIEEALLAGNRLGPVLAACGLLEFGSITVWEAQTDKGGVVRASFVVAYQARLNIS